MGGPAPCLGVGQRLQEAGCLLSSPGPTRPFRKTTSPPPAAGPSQGPAFPRPRLGASQPHPQTSHRVSPRWERPGGPRPPSPGRHHSSNLRPAGPEGSRRRRERRPTRQPQRRVRFNGHSKGCRTWCRARLKPRPLGQGHSRVSGTRLCKGGPAPEPQLCTREPPARPQQGCEPIAHQPPSLQARAPTAVCCRVLATGTQPQQAPTKTPGFALGEAFGPRPPKAELDSCGEPGRPGRLGSRQGLTRPSGPLSKGRLAPTLWLPRHRAEPVRLRPGKQGRREQRKHGRSGTRPATEPAGQTGRPGAGDQIRQGWGAGAQS